MLAFTLKTVWQYAERGRNAGAAWHVASTAAAAAKYIEFSRSLG
jgi:hypothetical protein